MIYAEFGTSSTPATAASSAISTWWQVSLIIARALAMRPTTGLFQKRRAALVDGWGVTCPAGKVPPFQTAVQAKDGETVIFGWIEWPDKPTRDKAWGR
jgi:hypothetical protein